MSNVTLNVTNHSNDIMASVAHSLMNGIKPVIPSLKKVTKPATPKVAKPVVAKTASPSKIVHPDGTVFFRADRNKWIAMADGKQEAARDTAEKCVQFINKKYPGLTANVLPKE
jgi:hypothetical protein